MNDLIDIFVNTYYSEDAMEDIYQTFGLFRAFNYLDPFVDIQNMLMMESYVTPEALQDGVTSRIIEAQDYLLDRHGITVHDECTLADRMTILRCLFMVQKLDNPTPFLRVLESLKTDDEKICTIMSMLSDIPETTLMMQLQEVRPITTIMLSQYLYTQEDNQSNRAHMANGKVQEYVKLFTEVFGINPGVRVILNSDAIQGEEFSLYLPLYQELRQLITDETVLVELLLFMLLYSSDGVEDPVKVYNEYSADLVPDMLIASRLGTTLGIMYTKLQRHREKSNP